ncbi:acyltransferase family protein [Kosakonia sp. MUSA4]|uniref:acyltransferase family protein n=1 Tax=Kosakonia sp. MUSA4 TaxID=2067958 RepID=UPI001597F745|nr:acyltransferase family protein [Kosakonia sp. MUSA4]QJT79339.1 acyltransferase [Kosakonia sp. MUSA4]
MAQTSFRHDINWLRALAVIAVVLYHFKTPYFNSGFIGVDIFFVISGFLMTGIITKKDKPITLISFYTSRFLRIFPALCFVVIFMMIAGFFILSTKEYEELNINAIASLLFFSNKYYALHSSYFDTSSENNFFLHTWSLSVEWQFYLLYPIIILLINKIKIPIKIALLTLFIISFTSVAFNLFRNNENLFYSLSARAWEMVSGGLIYVFSGHHGKLKSRPFLTIIGTLLVIYSIYNIDNTNSWPNIYTALPVAGAAIIIASNNQNSRFIRNKILQYIGSVSYSWYLWHWPVIVLMRHYNITFCFMNIAFGILISFIIANLSYHLVETPLRQKQKVKTDLIAGISIVVLCLFSFYTNGMAFRLKGDVNDIVSFRFNNEKWRPDTCFLNPTQDYSDFLKCNDKITHESIVVWGDSHAAQLMPGLMLSLKGENIAQRTSSLCGPLLNAENNQRPHCKNINTHVFNEILLSKPKLVIMAAFWSQYPFKDYLSSTLKELSKSGIRTLVIGPFPFWHEPLPKEIEIHGLNAQKTLPVALFESKKQVRDNDQKIKSIVEHDENAKYISALEVLCNTSACKATIGESPVIPMQWDNAHLTNQGSEWFINQIGIQIK